MDRPLDRVGLAHHLVSSVHWLMPPAIFLIGHLEKHIMTSADFDGVEPSLAMDLLSHYWDRQLHAGLVVYRTVFMRDLAASGGTFFSKLLLNALFFSASKHVPESWEDSSDPASSGSRYRKRFFELLEGERYRCSITTIQGLLIVANTLFSRCDERSLSWLLTGNAFQMLVHMRLHLDDHSEPPEAREVRRRLYWGAYGMYNNASITQPERFANSHLSLGQSAEPVSRSTTVYALLGEQRAHDLH
jgi:hypothetical protein